MLVVGSSLMVYSGYRFVTAMAEAGKPIAAINLGRTRADDLLTLKVTRPVHERASRVRVVAAAKRCPRRCQAGAVSGLPLGTIMNTTARVGPSGLAEPFVV